MANPPHRAAAEFPRPLGGDPAQSNGHRSNGHGAEGGGAGRGGSSPAGPEDGQRRPPGPSVKPAFVVFAIVLVVFVSGFLADLLTSSSPSSPSPSAAATAVPGTGGLVPEPARHVLAAVVTPGQPPADVLAALVVPTGTRYVPGSALQQGLGLYDGSVRVELPAGERDAITFFRAELAAGRWHLLSAGAVPGGGYRFIAQHPGSDGYEWEVGETLAPTAFSSQIPGATVPAAGVTPATLRLFAVSDQS
jgi:hypothetical protein